MKLEQYKDNSWLTRKYCIDWWSPAKIARECGVHTTTIRHWIKKHGIHVRGRSEAARLRADLKRGGIDLEFANKTYRNRSWLEEKRIKQRLTVVEIGRMCGVHSATICYWLKIWGFKQIRVSPERMVEPMAFGIPRFMRKNIDEFCRIKKIKRSVLIKSLIIDKMRKEGFDPYK